MRVAGHLLGGIGAVDACPSQEQLMGILDPLDPCQNPTAGTGVANWPTNPIPTDGVNQMIGPSAAAGTVINPVTGAPVMVPCPAGSLMSATGACVATAPTTNYSSLLIYGGLGLFVLVLLSSMGGRR